MATVRGHLAWIDGMETYTVEELDSWAAKLEMQARPDNPTSMDDPRWLRRRATKMRCMAEKKEKAREHKASGRKP